MNSMETFEEDGEVFCTRCGTLEWRTPKGRCFHCLYPSMSPENRERYWREWDAKMAERARKRRKEMQNVEPAALTGSDDPERSGA